MGRGSAGGGAAVAARRASAGGAKGAARRAGAGETFSGHDRLTPSEFEAIKRYQEGGTHFAINERLRGLRPGLHSSLVADIPHLNRAIAKATLLKDTTLYRGVTLETDVTAESLVGSTFGDKGFGSTSTLRSVADKFAGSLGQGVVFRIHARAGQKGLAVHKIDTGSKFSATGKDPEHEVLLPRKSGLRVTGARRLKNGLIVANAELVQ